ncbi:uncharacterized protein LOC106180080 isoform X2 [Lingula anatina]|uniref:Uncharacterized protein LOC106180080 isoform X2 n=1 Tax=Lingula anatina TaxID=7574 RepID=A0A1S3KA84_LINAN|nr:uncharacterized protein LOC106180080 isoform X2 [Lingula anatina]|eukprot:XP_013419412.1 uncharacterized protein LOC106180080 isoform X2 [Lingula anatina]
MGDFAYHQEVLRKARVIERKREAARATDIQFGEEFTNSVGTKSGKREQVAARYNDYRKLPDSRSEKTSWYEKRAYDHSREGPILGSTWRSISRELHHQDHNMATSNSEAFMQLFNPKTISVPRTPKTPVRTLRKYFK